MLGHTIYRRCIVITEIVSSLSHQTFQTCIRAGYRSPLAIMNCPWASYRSWSVCTISHQITISLNNYSLYKQKRQTLTIEINCPSCVRQGVNCDNETVSYSPCLSCSHLVNNGCRTGRTSATPLQLRAVIKSMCFCIIVQFTIYAGRESDSVKTYASLWWWFDEREVCR